MKNTLVFFLSILIISLLPTSSHAALVLHPPITGYSGTCSDATGAPVYTDLEPGTGDVAHSMIWPDGTRIITIYTGAFYTLPTLLQLFTYAHECGHHLSGDIVNSFVFHHDNMEREKNADRIGIRLMRDELNITPAQAQIVADYFRNNPPIPPYYLAGPLRAQWIVDCFNSSDDSCGHSSVVYKPSTVSDNSAASMGPFCEQLKKFIAESPTGFKSFRTNYNEDADYWDSKVAMTGFDSCTISPLNGDSSAYMLCDGSQSNTFDNANTQLKSCLVGWSRNEYTDSDGRKNDDLTSSSGNTEVQLWEDSDGGLSLNIER